MISAMSEATVTVADLYGKNVDKMLEALEASKVWEFEAFRNVQVGEDFLPTPAIALELTVVQLSPNSLVRGGPRIVVRKKKQVRFEVKVLENTPRRLGQYEQGILSLDSIEGGIYPGSMSSYFLYPVKVTRTEE